MATFAESYAEIESALRDRYGQLAHPAAVGDDAFRSVVAVVFGTAIDPERVPAALGALQESAVLGPQELSALDSTELAEILKESRVAVPAKALTLLRRVSQWIVDRHGGSVESLGDVATKSLREELAEIRGVGLATADAILLSGLRRAVYPVDRASYRILVRHGWLDPTSDYDEAQSVLTSRHAEDPAALERLSLGLERVGREYCRARVAKCEQCPLRPFLPARGPLDPLET
jgi:endonuclease-3 related protein